MPTRVRNKETYRADLHVLPRGVIHDIKSLKLDSTTPRLQVAVIPFGPPIREFERDAPKRRAGGHDLLGDFETSCT